MFRHRFLDAFLGCIFDGFGRLLDHILNVLGCQTELKRERQNYEKPMFYLRQIDVVEVSGHQFRHDNL